jgi:hypothetical protein
MDAGHRFQGLAQSGKMRGYQIGLAAGFCSVVQGQLGFSQEMGF